jgi:NAD(P)H-hydrate repair Nnr-like enzyme with NAD(P)H-hydrate dehydratase domain
LAGKLLVVGGSDGGIHDVAQSFSVSKEAGIGEVRVLVPDKLKPITKHIEGVDFLPATSTGNFAHSGGDQLLFMAGQVNGVLLPGNIGRNSETAMLLADLIRSYSGKLCITKDAIDALYGETNNLLNRPHTLLVVSFAQLQRLAKESKSPTAIRSDMDFLIFIERLHDFSLKHSAAIITKHHDHILLALNGKVITTARKDLNELWCIEVASKAIVYWIQHPNSPDQAIGTSLIP